MSHFFYSVWRGSFLENNSMKGELRKADVFVYTSGINKDKSQELPELAGLISALFLP